MVTEMLKKVVSVVMILALTSTGVNKDFTTNIFTNIDETTKIEKTTIEETTIEETTIEEQVVEETPIEETTEEETTIEETTEEETTEEETTLEETTIEETTEEETTVEETTEEETTEEETTVEETTIEETTVEATTEEETIMEEPLEDETIIEESTVDETTIDETTIAEEITTEANVAETTKKELKVGDKLDGFTVVDNFYFDMRDANVSILKHDKTGAAAIIMANDDVDKMTCISFNTFANNNRGMPHILEHSTLGGSKKYPSSDIFFNAMSKTYNTFMNAITDDEVTAYPVSSLDEEQLFALYKFYLDATLAPNILTDKHIFDREAYHYVLHDKNDALDLTGVVYNEMKGAFSSLDSICEYYSRLKLFEGTYMANVSGGKPDEIADLTYEELVEFYKKYYHPSNMLLTLYGNLDYEKYLAYVNEEYLTKYDKVNVEKPKIESKNLKERVVYEGTYELPVSKEQEGNDNCVFQYTIKIDNLSIEERTILDEARKALYIAESPIKKELIKKLPNANIDIDFDYCYSVPCFYFRFTNVKEGDKETVRQIVEDGLKTFVENGIPDDALTMLINDNTLSSEFTRDSHGFANEALEFTRQYFITEKDNGRGYFEFLDDKINLQNLANDGTVKKVISKYLGDYKEASFICIVNKPGLLEENNKKDIENLQKKKASMSEVMIENLIKATEDFDKYIEIKDENVMKDICVASVSNLANNIASRTAFEENVEGVRFVSSTIEDIQYNDTTIRFNTNMVPFEDLHKLNLMGNLLLNIDTEEHTKEEIKGNFEKNCYNYEIGANIIYNSKSGYTPTLKVEVVAYDKNKDKLEEIIKEVLTKSKWDDIKNIRANAEQLLNNMELTYKNNPAKLSQNLLISVVDDDMKYAQYLNEIEYYKFLKNVVKMSDDELLELGNSMKNILANVLNKSGMIVTIIANDSMCTNLKQDILDFAKTLKDERIVNVDYSQYLNNNKKKIAVVLDTNVNYNYQGIAIRNNRKLKGTYSILDQIITNEILVQKCRYVNGAYGAYMTTNDNVSCFWTYRDPKIGSTKEIFDNVVNDKNNISFTDEEINGYKLAAYATKNYPKTKFELARIAIQDILAKEEESYEERTNTFLNEIKAFTVANINEEDDLLNEIVNSDVFVTIGSKEEIENNKNLYEEIIYDLVNND